jgi:uncharacterized membrane protein
MALKDYFLDIVNGSIFVVEAVGVVILLIYTVRALVAIFKSIHNCKRLLSEGITTSLSFLLVGEVLKTIVAPDWKDIGMTCAILLMRAAVTVLLHWERQHEEE